MIEENLAEFIEILMLASAVAIAIKFIRFPYTIALVIAGLIVGLLGILPELPLSKEVVFLIFLPPLLFEAAMNMDLRELRDNFAPISAIAFLGVIFTTLFVGFSLNWIFGISLELSLLLGAMISATDPVSVLATFKSISAPKKLSVILEGESVLNDGAAIVVFAIALEMIKSGTFDLLNAGLEFLVVCAGGAAVGLAVGYLAYRILGKIDDALVEIAITIVVAYLGFILAERFHLSGIIAVVAAGLILGNYGKDFSMSPTTRVTMVDFWSIVVFLINSVIFILIGVNTHLTIFSAWKEIIAAVIAMILARAFVVYPVLTYYRFPNLWKHVVFWGGLRGVIPVALALSFGNATLSAIVFGVVIFSLLVQGLSLEIFVKKKFLDEEEREVEEAIARYIAARSAKFELKKAVDAGRVLEPLAEEKLLKLDEEIEMLRGRIEEFLKSEKASKLAKSTEKFIVDAKKSSLLDAMGRGLVSQDVALEIMRELDSEISDLLE